MERPKAVRANLARKVAREVLRNYGITYPPVDARALVANKARIVATSRLDEDGFTAFNHIRSRYYAFINPARVRGRANFTFAHEAGHVFLRHPEQYDCNGLTEYERWILDREANIFAAELLMPEPCLEKFVPVPCGPEALEQASRLFGVSQEALVNRLAELGIQERTVTEALAREQVLSEQRRRLERVSLTPAMVLRWAEEWSGIRG